MDTLLQILVGYSVGSAALLAAAFASLYRHLELPWPARVGGFAMLIGLALTQLGHLQLAAEGASLSRTYVLVLFAQSLGFYWLFLGLLRPGLDWPLADWLAGAAAIALGSLVPLPFAIPLALALGSAAAVHLAVLVHRLRSVRRWFRLELQVLALFAAMGLAVAIAGALAPATGAWHNYAWVYASLIAIGFALVQWLLLAVPDLTQKTREAVTSAYAQTTLAKVDRTAAVARLAQLFEHERIYTDESLSLARVAELMELSSHQLSELVNTEFGHGFSRFVRQHRIEAAKRMLLDEPRASVLSVGLAVGFNSQSSFYVAFKELVGMVPSQYRRAAPE